MCRRPCDNVFPYLYHLFVVDSTDCNHVIIRWRSSAYLSSACLDPVRPPSWFWCFLHHSMLLSNLMSRSYFRNSCVFCAESPKRRLGNNAFKLAASGLFTSQSPDLIMAIEKNTTSAPASGESAGEKPKDSSNQSKSVPPLENDVTYHTKFTNRTTGEKEYTITGPTGTRTVAVTPRQPISSGTETSRAAAVGAHDQSSSWGTSADEVVGSGSLRRRPYVNPLHAGPESPWTPAPYPTESPKKMSRRQRDEEEAQQQANYELYAPRHNHDQPGRRSQRLLVKPVAREASFHAASTNSNVVFKGRGRVVHDEDEDLMDF